MGHAIAMPSRVAPRCDATCLDQEAFRWTAANGCAMLGWISSQSIDLSSNGPIVVGQHGSPAAIWTEPGDLIDLSGSTDTGLQRKAHSVTADGRTVVGYPEIGIASEKNGF